MEFIIIIIIIVIIIIPWSKALLQNSVAVQLLKKFRVCYGT
jgi:hypothetical protein